MIFKHRPCPITLSIKVAHNDKHKMLQDMKDAVKTPCDDSSPDAPPEPTGLPPLKHIGPGASRDGWITFDKEFLYICAGKGPYISPDVKQFPVSLPTDGLIDISVQERVRRAACVPRPCPTDQIRPRSRRV